MKEQGSGDDADNAEENKRQEDVDNSPVVKLVNNIIEGGVRQRASDIHIEPFEYNVRVRYRIDGVLREIISYDRALYAAIIARLKVISGMDISEKRKPHYDNRGQKGIRYPCQQPPYGIWRESRYATCFQRRF